MVSAGFEARDHARRWTRSTVRSGRTRRNIVGDRGTAAPRERNVGVVGGGWRSELPTCDGACGRRYGIGARHLAPKPGRLFGHDSLDKRCL